MHNQWWWGRLRGHILRYLKGMPMPTVLRVSGARFFFYSLEGTEPPHIQVEQGDAVAKFWLDPVDHANSRGF